MALKVEYSAELNKVLREQNTQLRADNVRLRDALAALGSMPTGYCFCRDARDPDKSDHTGECVAARAVLANEES
jgi:hypothetical protein